MSKQAHVGGSILPSNEPRILRPVETSRGTFHVRVIADLDTHGLFYKHRDGETLLAEHANGYSCHVLLLALTQGDAERAKRQIQYILDCGGMTRHPEHILNCIA